MKLLSILFLALALIVCASAAQARGTLTVQKAGKPIDSYANVRITIANKTLMVTSADGKGTLIIDKAACSYVGELQMCLPYDAKLKQGGTTSPIHIQKGTAYVNLTGTDQPLQYSSMRLPPRGILFSMTTKIGTIVNLTGVIDEISK